MPLDDPNFIAVLGSSKIIFLPRCTRFMQVENSEQPKWRKMFSWNWAIFFDIGNQKNLIDNGYEMTSIWNDWDIMLIKCMCIIASLSLLASAANSQVRHVEVDGRIFCRLHADEHLNVGSITFNRDRTQAVVCAHSGRKQYCVSHNMRESNNGRGREFYSGDSGGINGTNEGNYTHGAISNIDDVGDYSVIRYRNNKAIEQNVFTSFCEWVPIKKLRNVPDPKALPIKEAGKPLHPAPEEKESRVVDITGTQPIYCSPYREECERGKNVERKQLDTKMWALRFDSIQTVIENKIEISNSFVAVSRQIFAVCDDKLPLLAYGENINKLRFYAPDFNPENYITTLYFLTCYGSASHRKKHGVEIPSRANIIDFYGSHADDFGDASGKTDPKFLSLAYVANIMNKGHEKLIK